MTLNDKTVEELSKFGTRALDTVDKAVSWLDTIFGESMRNVGGMTADWTALRRLQHRLKVIEKAGKLIEQAGLSGSTRPLSERIALPLLDAIEQESDDTLQDVWATYIKNAVDPKQPNPHRVLIDVIRRLEPADWPVLQLAFKHDTGKLTHNDLGIDEVALGDIMDRLHVLGLFEYDDATVAYVVISKPETLRLVFAVGDSDYLATRLLRLLAKATAS